MPRYWESSICCRRRRLPRPPPAAQASRRFSGSCRLLSTAAAALHSHTLEQQLEQTPWVQLYQIPGQVRGLFAARDLEQGALVLHEGPMLAAPSPHALDTTCAQCLAPLPAAGGGGQAMRFCSPGCSSEARHGWARIAAAANFAALQQACRESGTKFALMAAQLACLTIQHEWGGPQAADAHGSAASGAAAAAAPAAPVLAGDGPTRGDPLTQLSRLCFANMLEPPQPWVQLHSLLLLGLEPLCSDSGVSREWLHERLSLQWFCKTMAHLNLNSFRQADFFPACLVRKQRHGLGSGCD